MSGDPGPRPKSTQWDLLSEEEQEAMVRDAEAWREGLRRSLAHVGYETVEEFEKWLGSSSGQ